MAPTFCSHRSLIACSAVAKELGFNLAQGATFLPRHCRSGSAVDEQSSFGSREASPARRVGLEQSSVTRWPRPGAAMAEANNAPPPPETRTPLSPINGRRRRLAAGRAETARAEDGKAPPLAAGLTSTPRGELVDGATLAAVSTRRRRRPPPRCRSSRSAADTRPRGPSPDTEAASARRRRRAPRDGRRAVAVGCDGQLLDALRDAHETRLEVARRRVKDLEFELQRQGRDGRGRPRSAPARARGAFRQEAAQAARRAERAARDAADALAVIRVKPSWSTTPLDAGRGRGGAQAWLWNAHVALVEKPTRKPSN